MMTIDDILLKRHRKFTLRMMSSTNSVLRYFDIQFIISRHYK